MILRWWYKRLNSKALAAVDSKRTGATLARGSCDAGSSGEGGAGGGPCASCREQLPQPSPPSRPCCRRGAAGAAAPAPRLAGFLAATCGGGACAGGAGPGGAREGRGARCSEEARGAPGKGRSGAAGREWEVAAAVSELDSIKGSRRAPHMIVDAGCCPWRVVYMNAAAQRALGGTEDGRDWRRPSSPAGAEGRPLSDLFDLSDAAADWEAGGWAFDLSPVSGAECCEDTAGRQYALHCSLCGLGAGDSAHSQAAPAARGHGSDGDRRRSLFVVRVDEDATSAVVALLRQAAASDAARSPRLASDGGCQGSCCPLGCLPAPSADCVRSPLTDAGSAAGVTVRGGDSAGELFGDGAGGCGVTACGSIALPRRRRASAGGGGSRSGGAPRGGCACLLRGCPIAGLLLGPLLGLGSYGRVHRGIYQGHPVAVKVIDSTHGLPRGPDGAPSEAAAARCLPHPNLVAVHAAAEGCCRGACAACAGRRVFWMVQELCDGGNLADAVASGWFMQAGGHDEAPRRPDDRRVARAALDVARACEHLHARGILHGDLCGSNVLLQSLPAAPRAAAAAAAGPRAPHGAFLAKLSDFGLCRPLRAPAATTGSATAPAAAAASAAADGRGGHDSGGSVTRRSADGSGYGTITHVAPEVLITGESRPASEIYSFGVLLLEMLTGSPAWAGLPHAGVVHQVAVLGRAPPTPPAGALPAAAEALLRACLARDPTARPAFPEVVRALEAWLAAEQ